MVDPFKVFDIEPRPYIDLEFLKERYHRLSEKNHPDIVHEEKAKKKEEVTSLSQDINQAYEILKVPSLRLKFLLEWKTGKKDQVVQAVANQSADFFLELSSFVHRFDTFLRKKEEAFSALEKAELMEETMLFIEEVGAQLEKISNQQNKAISSLKLFDEEWGQFEDGGKEEIDRLRTLYQQFSFLNKWEHELQERQFQLTNEI